jgi:pimeloyl-ACP methyl ester carboxylesterase
MKGLTATLAVASLLAAGLTGCEGSGGGDPGPAAYQRVSCPDDVEVLILAEHECGMVAAAGGVSLFVVRVEPPTPSDRAPVVEAGTDLGTAPDYVGLSPIAQRTDRPLVLVDLRGTGHSTPAVHCPEVDALATAAAADPDAAAAELTAAVAACRARLTAAGTDPGSVDLASTAEDLHAVVHAMGIDKAVASAHGTTGLAALEWARRHPADLEAMVLDSPYFAGEDPDRRVDDLVDEVSRACWAERRCSARYADVADVWAKALVDLAAHPIRLESRGTAVRLDDDALRRAVRWVMAGGSQLGPGRVPEVVVEAAARRPGALLQRFADLLVAGPPMCVGYLPKCGGSRVSVGAALSLNCPVVRDQAVWREPCAVWGTAGAPRSTSTVSTPTLVLTGRFDPFAPPTETVRTELADVVPGAFYVEDPAGPHNVLGGDCMRTLRTAWLNGDVRDRPAKPPCLADRALTFTS